MKRDILTKTETAEELGISIATLDRLIGKKQIEFVKLGEGQTAKVIFQRSDVDAFIRRQKVRRIRDSVKDIKQVLPKDAAKRQFHLQLDRDQDFLGYSNLIHERLESWQKDLICKDWLEPELVKQANILYANLEAVRELCVFDIPDLRPALVKRLFQREVALWDGEIAPKLRLAERFLDVGKLKCIELRTKSGMPMNVRITGECYVISPTEWTPIPPLSAADGAELFHRRGNLDIRLALKTRKPVSWREQQAAAEAEKQAHAEAQVALEIELLEPEEK